MSRVEEVDDVLGEICEQLCEDSVPTTDWPNFALENTQSLAVIADALTRIAETLAR